MACFDGVDCIIHLAGATVSKPWTKKYKTEILNSRLDTTQLLVDSLKNTKHKIKSIVSASAIGVYPSSLDKIHKEQDPVAPNSFMEQVVVDWEGAVDQFSDLNIKVSKLRIGLVLAQGGGVLATLKIPTQFGLGAAFGSGNQWQSWIHVSDLSKLFLVAASQQWEGVYNAVAPEAVSQREFSRTLAGVLNRPHFFPNVPAAALRLWFGEAAEALLASHKVRPERLLEAGYSFEFSSLEKALFDAISA